jgi:hypothetical protein
VIAWGILYHETCATGFCKKVEWEAVHVRQIFVFLSVPQWLFLIRFFIRCMLSARNLAPAEPGCAGLCRARYGILLLHFSLQKLL